MSALDLVDPIPKPKPPPLTVHIRPAREQILFVDNGKPNSLAILHHARRLLRERGIDVSDDIPAKGSAGVPLDDELFARLAGEQGLVLLGVND